MPHNSSCVLPAEVIFYLDDGTLGGVLSDVLHDIEVIKKEAGIVGLDLNPQKSEVIGINSATIQSALSGIRVVNAADATIDYRSIYTFT